MDYFLVFQQAQNQLKIYYLVQIYVDFFSKMVENSLFHFFLTLCQKFLFKIYVFQNHLGSTKIGGASIGRIRKGLIMDKNGRVECSLG
jgi:hypothetical protein